MVRRHRRYLTQRRHPGVKTGLLFPPEAGTSPRGQGKHLHDSRGVTVEEMRQASMALMELVPTEPTEV